MKCAFKSFIGKKKKKMAVGGKQMIEQAPSNVKEEEKQ